MKVKLPDKLLLEFTSMAMDGEGRERDAGGGNTSVDITVLGGDVAAYPELAQIVGGTVRIYLNKVGGFVGYAVRAPLKKIKNGGGNYGS